MKSGARRQRTRGGLTLDEMFSRQASRVKHALACRTTNYRRRLKDVLEDSQVVERRGYTQGGIPHSTFRETDEPPHTWAVR